MPYEVTAEGAVSILKANDTYYDSEGKLLGYDHESNTFLPGEIVKDDDVSPVVAELYDNGDEHVTSILKRLTPKSESKTKTVKKEGQG